MITRGVSTILFSAALFCHSWSHFQSFLEAQERVWAASELAHLRVLRWRQSAEDCCKTWLGQDSTKGQNVHMCGHRAALARHFSVPKLVLGSRDFTLCGIITTKLEQMLLFECSSRALLACKLSCKLFLIGTGTICRRLLLGTEFIYTAAAGKATEGVVLTWMFWETVRRQVRSCYVFLPGGSGKLYAGRADVIMVPTWWLTQKSGAWLDQSF